MPTIHFHTKRIIGRTKWVFEYFSYLALVEYRTKWIRISEDLVYLENLVPKSSTCQYEFKTEISLIMIFVKILQYFYYLYLYKELLEVKWFIHSKSKQFHFFWVFE